VRPVLDAGEMREADRATIEDFGVPGAVLMENAGSAAARQIAARYSKAGRVVVLCGRGNNGGDGFVIARRLRDRAPVVLLFARRAAVVGDAARHLRACEKSGVEVREVVSPRDWRRERPAVLEAQLVVDALLGTGLREAPRGLVARVLRDLDGRSGPVAAVDLPSGVSSDSGRVPGAAACADLTVTFAALKYGHVVSPADARCGDVVVCDIGIPASLLAGARGGCIERAEAAAAWGRRARDAHKGSFGHVLVVAGSRGKSGAAVLSGTAALRAGAGLATVATPVPAWIKVARGRPELMTQGLPATRPGTLARRAALPALRFARTADAVVLGPGLGRHRETDAFVSRFVAGCPQPLVVDADALNALAVLPRGGAARVLGARKAGTVLTPHPGEAARLLGRTTRAVQQERLESVRRLARLFDSVVVLKGHHTLVARPDGRVAVNLSGGPALAIGGAGDVLAGMIGALLARGCDAWTAATAAVHVHGLAGDRLAAERGEDGLLAGDVADALPRIVRDLRS
jgi:NAD(P)H-hydrate epimerase